MRFPLSPVGMTVGGVNTYACAWGTREEKSSFGYVFPPSNHSHTICLGFFFLPLSQPKSTVHAITTRASILLFSPPPTIYIYLYDPPLHEKYMIILDTTDIGPNLNIIYCSHCHSCADVLIIRYQITTSRSKV